MKFQLIIIIWLLKVGLNAQPCNAFYSYTKQNELVSFQNLSAINNAHYYWNFGDCSGSNLSSPTHEYIENGQYLVTLYIQDTISKCHSFYETWLNVTKYSTDACNPKITDSIYSYDASYDYLKILDSSVNCNNYFKGYRVGALPFYKSKTAALPKTPANFIANVSYDDAIMVKRASYKTCPNRYDRTKNYGNCSANFEIKHISENSTGQRILFTAMQKNAKKYEWRISGLGDVIRSNLDTISAYFWGNINTLFLNLPYDVYLKTIDNNGCMDSLYQHVVVRKKSMTYVSLNEQKINLLSFSIYPNPTKDKINIKINVGNTQLKSLNILNTLGQVVFKLNEVKNEEEINLSFLPSGVYYLKVDSNAGGSVGKIIKE